MKIKNNYTDYKAGSTGEKWCQQILAFTTNFPDLYYHRLGWKIKEPRKDASGVWHVKWKTLP